MNGVLFTEHAKDVMRDAIANHCGVECLFGGKFNRHRVVDSVDMLAYGSGFSVNLPALSVMDYEVMVHNHPGGNIFPSPADVSAFQRFAEMGFGAVIINNSVTQFRCFVLPQRVSLKRMCMR